MDIKATRRRALALATAMLIGMSVSGCVSGFTSTHTQGYAIPDTALQQIRPGQSADLVIAVLGSPQTTNSFGNESAFYYVETRIEKTKFGLVTSKERRVLAVYFDENKRVKDTALYGLEDGRVIAIETRRTASFGEDRTFIGSILSSF